jgi:hypothetical protein
MTASRHPSSSDADALGVVADRMSSPAHPWERLFDLIDEYLNVWPVCGPVTNGRIASPPVSDALCLVADVGQTAARMGSRSSVEDEPL